MPAPSDATSVSPPASKGETLPAPSEVGLAAPGTACIACGYRLDQMRSDARCPECATPVIDSMSGDFLERADPEYVRTVARGSTLVFVGSLISLLWWILTPLMAALFVGLGWMRVQGAFLISQSIDFLAAICLLAGWWMVTTPNPAIRDVDRDAKSRRILRILLVVIAAITSLGFLGVFVPAFAAAGLAGISGNITVNSNTPLSPLVLTAIVLRSTLLVARIVRFLIGLHYMSGLIQRVPNPSLAASLARQQWAYPLWMTLGWAIVIGPLIGAISYLVALGRANGALWAVAHRAAERHARHVS